MPLIGNLEPTLEEKKAALMRQIRTMLTNNYNDLLTIYNAGNTMVWTNPDGLTPQDCFDAMGQEAAHFVQIGLEMAQMLNAAVPGSIDLSVSPPLQINEDGTVTVL